MTITLTPETGTLLQEQARQNGQDINSLADALLADALLADALGHDPDNLTDEETAEIRAGIRRGLEASATGRIKPLAQAVAEARQQHGFPASWASGISTVRCDVQ